MQTLPRSAAAPLLASVIETQRQIASADLDLATVMDVVLERVREITGAERAGIALETEGELVVAASLGMAPQTVGRPVSTSASVIGRVFESGSPLFSGDMPSIRDDAQSVNHSRSGAAMPLEHGGRRLGVLFCSSPRADAFDEEVALALELLAGLVGPAVAQARAFAAAQEEVALRTAIVDTMAEGVLIYDAEGRVRFVNRAAERMLRRPRRSMIGRDRRGARIRPHHVDGRPMKEDESFFLRAAAGETIVGEEWKLLRPDRTLLDVTVNAAAVRDDAGAASAVVVSLTDSTERRRAETTLRESEERLRAIIGSTLDGIVAIDGEGRIVEFNSAAETLFGRSRAETLGQRFETLLPQRLRSRAAAAFAERKVAPNLRLSARTETIAMRGDGTEIPVEISLTAVQQRGRPLYVISVRDLSTQLAAESARRESEAKSRFLASMSHELRTPLNAILGFAQLLERADYGELNNRQLRYVGHIEDSGRHLLGLINDVLDLTKVAAGELKVDLRPTELGPLAADAITRVMPPAQAKELQVVKIVAPGACALADPLRVSQVLDNLLSNAVKFTPAGGRVTLRVERGGAYVRITVADTGTGIPPERRDEIFEEFVQIESALDRRHDGTGLGLALTRRLVQLMGGTIDVESAVGVGSGFTVSLPAA